LIASRNKKKKKFADYVLRERRSRMRCRAANAKMINCGKAVAECLAHAGLGGTAHVKHPECLLHI
jgi:hypothetical protein